MRCDFHSPEIVSLDHLRHLHDMDLGEPCPDALLFAAGARWEHGSLQLRVVSDFETSAPSQRCPPHRLSDKEGLTEYASAECG
jgi:hypothetical protein